MRTPSWRAPPPLRTFSKFLVNLEVRSELLWQISGPFRAMLGVPHALKVGGLRRPTFRGTSGMGLRKIFSIFKIWVLSIYHSDQRLRLDFEVPWKLKKATQAAAICTAAAVYRVAAVYTVAAVTMERLVGKGSRSTIEIGFHLVEIALCIVTSSLCLQTLKCNDMFWC